MNNLTELEQLIALLKKYHVTKYKGSDVELELAIIVPSTPIVPEVVPFMEPPMWDDKVLEAMFKKGE